MLAARSIRASNSPPNKLFKGLVSLGRTKSVRIVSDSEGNFACMSFSTKINGKVEKAEKKEPQINKFVVE
jgi:hypothetical protein